MTLICDHSYITGVALDIERRFSRLRKGIWPYAGAYLKTDIPDQWNESSLITPNKNTFLCL